MKNKNNNKKGFTPTSINIGVSFASAKRGFTIIETMIAVSLFSIIIIMGTGSLLNTTVLHNKSQDVRSIIDNLSFIMEDISRNIRTGYDFHCIDDGNVTATDPHDCLNGGGISFKASTGEQWVYAIYPDGSIQKSVSGGTAGTFTVLNLPEIVISSVSSFSVSGALPPAGDIKQPYITIKLVGTITSKDNVVTPFSLQTSVSARLVDIVI